MAFFLVRSWSHKIPRSKIIHNILHSLPYTSQFTSLQVPAIGIGYDGIFQIPKPLARIPSLSCYFSSQPLLETTRTSDGLSVDDIVAHHWPILDESESDWKSHATAIAQSIQLIKKRLQWQNLVFRAEHLNSEMSRSDLWDNPEYAGRVSQEHGMCMGKIQEVKGFEQELLEHVEMLKLARDEGDRDLELESLKALLGMRRDVKERELKALLSGVHDSCSCFMEAITCSFCLS